MVSPATPIGEILDTATVNTALAALEHEWAPASITYRNSITGKWCLMYNPDWQAFYARAEKVDKYAAKTNFRTVIPTYALTGTVVAGGVTEAEMVTGGETLIITLSGGVNWAPAGATTGLFDTYRQSIIDALSGSLGAGEGFFDEAIRALLDVGDVVRTSDTVVTITFDAAAAYSTVANETVTVDVPAAALRAANDATVPYPHDDLTGRSFVITAAA